MKSAAQSLIESGEAEEPLVARTLVDITEHKQAEQALAQERDLLGTLMDNLPDHIYFKDRQSRFLRINRAHAKAFGLSDPGQAVGKTDFDFFAAEHAQQAYNDEQEVITTGKPMTAKEEKETWPDGRVTWASTTKMPFRDANGAIIGTFGVSRDITERKQAEKVLEERTAYLNTLIDISPVGIAVLDKEERIQMCNPAFERLFLFSREEMQGFNLDELIIPTELVSEAESLTRQTLGGASVHATSRRRRKDGTLVDVEIYAVPLVVDDKPLGFLGLYQDVTKRKQAEEALAQERDLLGTLMDNLPDTIYFKDRESRFTRINKALAKGFGLSDPGQAIGKTDFDFFTAEHAQQAYNDEQEVITTGKPMTAKEEKETWPDGRVTWVSTTKMPFRDANGAIIGTFGVSHDITERKRAEEERRSLEGRLQRAEKMEALGQLAGGVAHDLNNVLGILSGYSELLLQEIPEGQRSRGHVEKILQSTEKGASIIQDLLTLARRGVTASDVINLNGLVSGFLKTPVFEKMKDYHPRVTFRTECNKDLLNIKGSPVHLEKTLMNLVSNAAESISGKGEVAIRTESRYLDKAISGYDEVKEGDYTILTVSDTGMGIPAENIEKIFEPFYTKKTMGRSGTGLGLAIVWGTVKDHNGYIDVQTKVGEGTTFTLYFPVTREELIAPQQKEPIERYMGNGESVLLVDDIAEQRDVASILLTRLGYEVHVVSSGEEAVEYLSGNKADIIVLDMIMAPGIDGLETYQRVLEINPKQKAILVSGFSETNRVREAQKLGAGAYVKKPYVMEKIGVAIRDELNR